MPRGVSAHLLLGCEKVHGHTVGLYVGIREARKSTLDCKTLQEGKRKKRERELFESEYSKY